MNGFNVKLKSLMEMFIQMLRHMKMFYLASIYIYIYSKLYMYVYVKALWKFKNV